MPLSGQIMLFFLDNLKNEPPYNKFSVNTSNSCWYISLPVWWLCRRFRLLITNKLFKNSKLNLKTFVRLGLKITVANLVKIGLSFRWNPIWQVAMSQPWALPWFYQTQAFFERQTHQKHMFLLQLPHLSRCTKFSFDALKCCWDITSFQFALTEECFWVKNPYDNFRKAWSEEHLWQFWWRMEKENNFFLMFCVKIEFF